MNEIIISLIFTNTISLITNIFQYCYKSKCSKVSVCCKLIEIQRDILEEQKNDNGEMNFEFENIYFKNNNKKIVKSKARGKRKLKPKKIADIQTDIIIDDNNNDDDYRPRSQSI